MWTVGDKERWNGTCSAQRTDTEWRNNYSTQVIAGECMPRKVVVIFCLTGYRPMGWHQCFRRGAAELPAAAQGNAQISCDRPPGLTIQYACPICIWCTYSDRDVRIVSSAGIHATCLSDIPSSQVTFVYSYSLCCSCLLCDDIKNNNYLTKQKFLYIY